MGFFSRLFGRSKESKSVLNLSGPGTFSGEIMGESHYQDNLEDICGGRPEEGANIITHATLVLDDNNPYDNKAVRVDIGGRTVGHLRKTHARYYRRKLTNAGFHGVYATCKAKIVGGWDRGGGDVGHFGVRLDLPEDYVEGHDSSPSGEMHEKEVNASGILTFDVSKLDQAELPHCKINDYVSLWIPSKDPEKISIFRRGTLAGSGRLGFVPHKYFDTIASHMNKELPIETEIIELSANKCRIRCKLVSQDEFTQKLKSQRQEESKRIKTELTKKYSPKKGFAFRLQLPKTHNLHEGQSLYLIKKPIEYYVENPLPIRIEFVDENNNLVAHKENEPDHIRRILRAHFSGYELTFKILTVSHPDKYTLPYISTIEATAEVAFHKQSHE